MKRTRHSEARRKGIGLVLIIFGALSLVISLVSPASAVAPTTDDVTTACNNTVQPQKFPLSYHVVATPSASPVMTGSNFTVQFDVTLEASADFLNGVYASPLGATAIPLTESKVTIAPLSGATGAPVQAVMASPVTIPAPASVPVATGTSIHVGTVTGNYTAGAPGTARFTVEGNSWAPADSRPAGITEAGWTAAGALTTTGSQTYTHAAFPFFGSTIDVFIPCMGGSWTQTSSGPPAVFGPPVIAPTGFGAVPISAAASSSSSSSSTSSSSSSSTSSSSSSSTSSTTLTTTTSAPSGPTTSTTVAAGPTVTAGANSASPGGTVSLSGSNFPGSTTLKITFLSTPVALGTTQTNPSGSFSASVAIPSDATLGSHHIEVATQDGKVTVSIPIEIVAAGTPAASTTSTVAASVLGTQTSNGNLALTGSGTGWLTIGILCLVVGAMLFFNTRPLLPAKR